MRWACISALAWASVAPSGVVMSLSRVVITSETLNPVVSNCRSRRVTIPTSRPFSVTGMPEM